MTDKYGSLVRQPVSQLQSKKTGLRAISLQTLQLGVLLPEHSTDRSVLRLKSSTRCLKRSTHTTVCLQKSTLTVRSTSSAGGGVNLHRVRLDSCCTAETGPILLFLLMGGCCFVHGPVGPCACRGSFRSNAAALFLLLVRTPLTALLLDVGHRVFVRPLWNTRNAFVEVCHGALELQSSRQRAFACECGVAILHLCWSLECFFLDSTRLRMGTTCFRLSILPFFRSEVSSSRKAVFPGE